MTNSGLPASSAPTEERQWFTCSTGRVTAFRSESAFAFAGIRILRAYTLEEPILSDPNLPVRRSG